MNATDLPLIDHRCYTIALRKMPEFIEVFNRLAMPVLMQTLGHPLGFYTSLVGPQNQFVHLWAYESLADYERRCHARDTHPDFPAYLAASSHLITAQETRLIRALGPEALPQAWAGAVTTARGTAG
ncbi:NIPSNAP family protein [Hydrogenophaga sp. OTU3427]|uniref:NIPSNAP family protein n=1 Tax=Hydrogenophaga sp. OTU3427 TaxID=3043856 RepID=UPI00313ECB16